MNEESEHPIETLATRLARSGWRVPKLPEDQEDYLGLTARRPGQDEYLHINRSPVEGESYPDWRAKVRQPHRDDPLVSKGSGARPATAARDAGIELKGGDDGG